MRKSFTYDGQRHWLTCVDLTDFEVKKALLIRDIEDGKSKITKHMTVRAWGGEFAAEYLRGGNMQKSTYDDHLSRLNNHIYPEIGSMRLCDVKQIHCQRVLNRLAGYSEDRAKKVRSTMHRLFRAAQKNRLIYDNPADDLELPRVVPDGRRRSITDSEREITLRVAARHPAGLWVLTMLYCGLRPQETAALQWRCVDLSENVIRIETALKKDGPVGDPKTYAGSREIPIPHGLAAELRKAYSREPFAWVFTNSIGGRLSGTNMTKMWNNFKREMQIEAGCRVYRNKLVPPFPIADDLTPYCYRHTFCTDLQDAGVPINVAKELMGHTDIKTTAKIYTDFTRTSFEMAREKIDAYHIREKPAVQNTVHIVR